MCISSHRLTLKQGDPVFCSLLPIGHCMQAGRTVSKLPREGFLIQPEGKFSETGAGKDAISSQHSQRMGCGTLTVGYSEALKKMPT